MPTSRAVQESLDDYRITSSVDILALLEQVQSLRALVTLSNAEGASYTTLLCGIDTRLGVISFGADAFSFISFVPPSNCPIPSRAAFAQMNLFPLCTP